MKGIKIAALLCIMLIFRPSFVSAAGIKHPINVGIDHVARTLTSSERIAYGNAASNGQFPFMARLGWVTPSVSYTACGGTILSSVYILTAAHCMFDESNRYTPPTVILVGGTNMNDWNSFSERIPVAEGYVHPEYTAGDAASKYDVAIIKLATPTSFPAVTLATADPPAGTTLTSIGWGLTELSASGVRNSALLYTSLKVGTFGVSPCPFRCGQSPCTTLCELGLPAGGNGFTSACQGDSGGPQVLPGTTTQASIVSYGPEGCGTDPWGASTSIAFVRSWINSIIGAAQTPSPPSPSPSPSFSPIPSPDPTPTVDYGYEDECEDWAYSYSANTKWVGSTSVGSKRVRSLSACASACVVADGCYSFTYSRRKCYMYEEGEDEGTTRRARGYYAGYIYCDAKK